jgi:plasmid stability protein
MMSVNLSIKNASDEVVTALKLRAKQNHRSLQGELTAIIEEAAKANGIVAEQGLREGAAAWQRRDEATSARHEARERNIERAIALMKEGLQLGGQRFTREEMHER